METRCTTPMAMLYSRKIDWTKGGIKRCRKENIVVDFAIRRRRNLV